MGMLGMSNFGIKNNGTSTLGMSILGAASRTLNSGTNNDNNTVGFRGGWTGALNFGGEGTSVLGMSNFGIEKDSMSGTLISGTHKMTVSGTTLTSLGQMQWGTTACHQQCPILALTIAPLLALPIAAVTVEDNDGQKMSLPR